MDDSPTSLGAAPAQAQREDRLDSWKKIASYLKRDVSTVQRWERREAMPVHRHLHDKRGSVFAFRSELDVWWGTRRVRLTAEEASAGESAGLKSADFPLDKEDRGVTGARRPMVAGIAAAAAVVVAVGTLAWLAFRDDYFWRSPLANARFIRLPDLGTEQAATISRDGKLVAVLADRDGPTDIWLTEVDHGNYRNLTHGALNELNVSIRRSVR